MKTDNELRQLAKEVYDGNVFLAVDEYKLNISFGLLLAFGNFPDETVALYEDMDKAGPRSINGLPFFTSCKYLSKNEFETFREYLQEYEQVMKNWIANDKNK